MNRSIELPESICAAIERAAAVEGTTPVEWLVANVPSPRSGVCAQGDELAPEILAERFRALVKRAERLGGGLSERHGELFAEGMEEKRRMGNL